MNIQQNLNTLLAMGAVAARTSDLYKKNVALKGLNKAEKATSLLKEAAEKDVKSYDKKELSYLTEAGMKGANELNISYADKLADIREQKAQTDPSSKNIKSVIEHQDESTLARQKYENQQAKQLSQEKARKAKAEESAVDSLTDETQNKTSQYTELDNRFKNLYNFEVMREVPTNVKDKVDLTAQKTLDKDAQIDKISAQFGWR